MTPPSLPSALPPEMPSSGAAAGAVPKRESAAILSLVFGCLGFVCCGVGSVVAIISGHVARSRLAGRVGAKGKALATTGLLMGYAQLAFLGLIVVMGASPATGARMLHFVRLHTSGVPPTKVVPEETAALYDLIVPEGYDPRKPIPCAFYLHGFGVPGSDLLDSMEPLFQGIANRQNIAFIGITAGRVVTEGEDEGGRSWSEDAAEDQAHLEAVVKQHAAEVQPEWGKCVAFGFSQGGKLSGQLLATYPDKYCGALLFSPGGFSPVFDIVPPGTQLKGKRALCFHNAEAFGTIGTTAAYAKELEAAGAAVQVKRYPDTKGHRLPPDFATCIEGWITDVRGLLP